MSKLNQIQKSDFLFLTKLRLFIFVPLLFGLLVALITFPICKTMEKHRPSRSFSIAILLTCVVVTLLKTTRISYIYLFLSG